MKEKLIIDVAGVRFGGDKIVVMAGPCSVESEEQILEIAKNVKENGATILRGGAWKPRTNPHSFQGMEYEGLEFLRRAGKETNLPVVTEILSLYHIDSVYKNSDIMQVGARNMQNYELLKELGKLDKPVLLKRGFGNTIDELLMSAEYIMCSGNQNVILCERGIKTFETSTRNTLDISAIPLLKRRTHLPIVVDPSHSGGAYYLVEPLSMAAIAAGADGLLIEVHNDPDNALSDGAQTIKALKN